MNNAKFITAKEVIGRMNPMMKKLILTIFMLVVAMITAKLAIDTRVGGWEFVWFLWAAVSGVVGCISAVALIMSFWDKE